MAALTCNVEAVTALVHITDNVFTETLMFQQIGTSLAQSDQTRKRVSVRPDQNQPVLLRKSGTDGGDRTRTTLRGTGF
jgi:hypothetical protein